jgi:radical SAM protein with 4Fe4S-binding SPASM domain
LFKDKLLFLDPSIVVVGVLQFDNDLNEISKQLTSLRKEQFLPNERIVIVQENPDQYLYVDGDGKQLIEIQKLINIVDIGNCFILILTANANIYNEIKNVNQDYSFDKTLFDYCIFPGEYNISIPTYSNTACTKLWNHLYIGTDNNITPCCIADHRYPLGNIENQSIKSILDSKESTQLRQWMIDGYRVKSCKVCYNNEDNNIKSGRQSFKPKSVDREKIRFLDVRLNNICNFKCRMCSEYFSSSIQQETIDIFGKDAVLGYEKIDLSSTNRKTRLNNLQKLLPYVTKDLEKIYFAGGEPLITEEHYGILDQLIDVKNFNININYNTNLSKLVYKKQNVLDYWKHFTDVSVGASIDASGLTAEYVRHGTVWKDILDNINQIKNQTPHVNLTIASTVSWLTLENLMELQTLWIEQGLFTRDQLRINALVTPTFLCITSLPKFHKQRLSEKIKNHINRLGQCQLSQHWAEAKNFMNNTNSEYTLSEFTKTTRTLDIHRKESFVEVFPQFTDLFPVANDQQV